MSNSRDASPKRENSSVVYVVMKKESYEGGSIQAIFVTRSEARAFLIQSVSKEVHSEKWKKKTDDCWKRGSSCYEVEEYEVGHIVN